MVCAIVVTCAGLALLALGRYAEPHDVLAAALTHFNATQLVAVALLFALRLFLVLLAPGWVLYVAARWAIDSRQRRRSPETRP